MLAKTRLQVYRKRAREEAKEPAGSESSMITIWGNAIRRDGPKGLYQGIEAQIMKGFVSQGVTMMVKQR